MPVRNVLKQRLKKQTSGNHLDGVQDFPVRHPKAPVFPIPELNPEPISARGKRRRAGKGG